VRVTVNQLLSQEQQHVLWSVSQSVSQPVIHSVHAFGHVTTGNFIIAVACPAFLSTSCLPAFALLCCCACAEELDAGGDAQEEDHQWWLSALSGATDAQAEVRYDSGVVARLQLCACAVSPQPFSCIRA
jgi:hypothetical protein